MILRGCLAALAVAGAATAQEAAQPERTFAVGAVETGEGRDWMIVAAHPMAADAGAAVLAEGGSAVDAAIAAQLMLNLVEPQSSGLGGGGFALHWDEATGEMVAYDGRETAPLAATPDYWLGADGAPIPWPQAVPGGRSVGVPGLPALLEALHGDHGVLPRGRLAFPAIRAAREGFAVSPRLAASIAFGAERGLAAFPAAEAYFFDADGAPLAAGTRLRNPALADAVTVFGLRGAAPFYDGEIAGRIVDAVRAAPVLPGLLTREDLAAYRVIRRKPVCAPYRGHQVCGIGPPSSGGLTVGQMLMMLSHHDLGSAPSPAAWRRFVGAARLAFADRGLYMADADFAAMPEGLLNAGYMADRARLIGIEAAGEAAPGDPPWREGRAPRAPGDAADRAGTTHIVARDAAGNVISMTTTIETAFGSRLMVDGFLLNNELTDFSRAPARDGVPVANRVEGGKRPRSSMAPTIVMKGGAPVMALGSPGGSRIIPYVAQALVGVIDWGMSPAETVSMGHLAAAGDRVDLEEGTEAAALEADMAAFGLKPRVRNMNSGLAVMVISDDGLTGAADPRREGVVRAR